MRWALAPPSFHAWWPCPPRHQGLLCVRLEAHKALGGRTHGGSGAVLCGVANTARRAPGRASACIPSLQPGYLITPCRVLLVVLT